MSSLGAIPKSAGGIRLIHDASRRPECANLNSYATANHFQYDTIDKATKLIPPNGVIAKIDLKSAYRSVSIHDHCLPATGLKWKFSGNSKPTYMFDCRLPFGAKRSCEIFLRISNSITSMMAKRGYIVIAYHDDFLNSLTSVRVFTRMVSDNP